MRWSTISRIADEVAARLRQSEPTLRVTAATALHLGPDDVVVLHVSGGLSADEAARLHELAGPKFSPARVIILPEHVAISVASIRRQAPDIPGSRK